MNAEEYEYYDEEDDENIVWKPKRLQHDKRETQGREDKEKGEKTKEVADVIRYGDKLEKELKSRTGDTMAAGDPKESLKKKTLDNVPLNDAAAVQK